MCKYGLTKEEWKIYEEACQRSEVPDDWIDYSWDMINEYGELETVGNWFPNEKVAKAYFAAYGITNYYLETV